MPFQKICSSLFLLDLFTTPLAQAEGDPLVLSTFTAVIPGAKTRMPIRNCQ